VALDYLRTRKIYYQLNQDEVSDSRFTSMLNEFDIDAKRVLTDFEYDVVVLSIVYNLKRREVAKVLDRPLGTITRVYSEAMKKLKEFYENYT
ncbi:MAG TPA: sigma-70 family RNA polymerase sigma factor, partial [Acholeplasmataceae bacterium]|nr:sigma-70 family RNA polymerase sigma factor [Acholeplasmataceae bacterium]